MKKIIFYLVFLSICTVLIIPSLFTISSKNNLPDFSITYYKVLLFIFAFAIYYQYEFSKAQYKFSLVTLLINLGKIFLFFGILIFVQTIINSIFYFIFKTDLVNIDFNFNFFSVLSVILNFLILAFYEETLYRLYLPESLKTIFEDIYNILFHKKNNNFKQKYESFTKIILEVLCIFLFAIPHYYLGWNAVINAFICGFVLRICYLKNKTILIGTFSHFFYNCFIFITAVLL